MDAKYIDAAALEIRYNCDRSAFSRWTKKRGFPAPLYFGNRRLWVLDQIVAWEEETLSSEPTANVIALSAFQYQKTGST